MSVGSNPHCIGNSHSVCRLIEFDPAERNGPEVERVVAAIEIPGPHVEVTLSGGRRLLRQAKSVLDRRSTRSVDKFSRDRV